MTILTVQNLHKHFGNRVVLEGVSMALDERDRIGLIGANGSGKTTLLKMLVGDGMEPDEGTITWRRDLSIDYVAQEPKLDESATGRMILERPGVADHEVMTVAAALQLPPLEQRIGTLSIGERRRIALARALLGKP
ncbi:MAG: ATP-binding cassette domain-containing protein, partial [Proteobacteria bacterium]|nr:ATP-binding cassette domain-containing protein [Pseudomonadota bacterium]